MSSQMLETPVKPARTYAERIAALRAEKMAQTQEKWSVIGTMDYDDWALILPPPERARSSTPSAHRVCPSWTSR